jgi:GDPmannose 4,6-dehydratase
MSESPGARRALITGVNGQDGSYLAELLLEKGYEVHGLIRRASTRNLSRVEHLVEEVQEARRFFLHYGDVADSLNLTRILADTRPHEIYHLAAQSHVRVSFDAPEYTGNVDGLGTLRILEANRALGLDARVYQASTSELFGSSPGPQNEDTPFRPRSPYGIAKLCAYWMTVNFREAYGMFAVNGILFNHESPRRGESFVTRKITKGVARVLRGESDRLYLGNLSARRDWGYAKDYVEAMWAMLQQDTPQDLVIATGETHTVRDFCSRAFAWAGVDVEWHGEAEDEVGVDAVTGQVLVAVDPYYFRPTEVDWLQGDPRRALEVLGWAPSVTFEGLVDLMMAQDYPEGLRLRRIAS